MTFSDYLGVVYLVFPLVVLGIVLVLGCFYSTFVNWFK